MSHLTLTGLKDLADATRRSAALTVAMSITPAESTESELMSTADRMLAWLEQGRPAEQPFVPPTS